MKSAGLDGIVQDVLLLEADIIAIPLTRIINNSIENGVFPEAWKKAVVSPNIEKGRPKRQKELQASKLPSGGIKST